MSTIHRTAHRFLPPLLVLAFVVGALAPQTAWSQRDPLDIESMIKQRPVVGGDEKKEDPDTIGPPEENEIQLEVQWGLRRGADNNEARDRIFGEVVKIVERMGLPNRPFTARALLEESAEALEKGDAATAQTRIDQARQLAPALPMVEFAQASLALQTSPLNILSTAGHLISGYKKSWRYPPSRFQWFVKGMGLLWLALCVFGLGMVLVVCARHLGLLAGDLRRFLPEGVARFQIILLLLVLILAPVLLTGSLMVSAVVTVLLVSAYMSWSERIAMALVLAALALLPQIFTFGGAGFSYPGSESSELVRWGIRGCQQECQGALAVHKIAKDEDPRFSHARRFLAANSALKRGPATGHKALRETFQAMMDDPTLPRDMKPVVLNNLGVLEALLGDLDASKKSFETVAQMTPEKWGPWHNLFRVLEQKGDKAAAEPVLQHAIKIGGAEASARSSLEDRTIAMWFYLEELPLEPLFDAHLEATATSDNPTVKAYWLRIGGELPLNSMPLMAGGALAILFVLTLIGRAAGAAEHCPRCDGPMASGRDDLSGQEGETCRACAFCFEGRGTMTYNERVEHEGATERHHNFTRVSWWGGNIVYPGLGAALSGVSVGLVPMVLVALGVGLLAQRWDVLGDPWYMVTLWEDGTLLVSVALFLLAEIISITLMWLGVPSYSPKAPPKSDRPVRRPEEREEEPVADGY